MHEDKKHGRLKKPISYLIAIVLASATSVALFAGVQLFMAKRAQRVLDNPVVAESKPAPTIGDGVLQKTSESFRQVAKIVGPAVVNIKSTKGSAKKPGRGGPSRRGGRRGMPPQQEEEEGMPRDPLFDFFERFGGPFNVPDTPQTSLGSGIVVDKRGYVVTNNHVVEDASEILVSFATEKNEMKAKVIGTDPKTDLAVIKIDDGKDLPVAQWADSDSVEVGDWAIAIGSPFDLRQTVTVGIVSAKGRSSSVIAGADYVGELLQTDAAINPGNSGGPLCTLDGKVMGVNTAIYTRSGGYMGIGFAIPASLAKDVVNKLITDGKIVRGWLGVYIQPLDPELTKDLGVKDGVGIHEVIEKSPAAVAGLRAGDVVIEVDGKPVKEVNQLQRLISSYKPNQTVKIKVVSYADKKTKTISVKIGTLPDAESAPTVTKEDDTPDKLGVVAGEMKGKEGVAVQGVQPGSIAEQIGLQQGDVIASINRSAITNLASYKKELDKALSGKKRKILALEVKRKGRTLFFQFVVPE